jgi:curved DNA-binding protein CbpA
MPRRNLYIVLGIPPGASAAMIRSAYRTLAKAYHPDRIDGLTLPDPNLGIQNVP